jgi:hypothetical protein
MPMMRIVSPASAAHADLSAMHRTPCGTQSALISGNPFHRFAMSIRNNHSGSDDCRSANRRPKRREGAIIVELLLALPLLIIALLAALEFGVMMSNFQQISLASRDGALVASETMGLDTAVNVPPDIVNVIQRQLGSSGMTYCRIRLEHNIGGPQTALFEPVANGCDCGPAMFAMPVPPRPYVRVTVCVDMTQAAPNCLKNFGFDLTGQEAEFTTLMRHEMPNP